MHQKRCKSLPETSPSTPPGTPFSSMVSLTVPAHPRSVRGPFPQPTWFRCSLREQDPAVRPFRGELIRHASEHPSCRPQPSRASAPGIPGPVYLSPPGNRKPGSSARYPPVPQRKRDRPKAIPFPRRNPGPAHRPLVIHKQLRELLLQRLDLRPVADQDVGIVRDCAARNPGGSPRRDRKPFSGVTSVTIGFAKHLRRVQLRDVGLRNPLLVVVLIEDRRPVRRAHIRPLPVQLRRIVRHRKEDAQQLPVRDLRRIVDHLHRLGVPRRLRRHLVVGCRRRRSARSSPPSYPPRPSPAQRPTACPRSIRRQTPPSASPASLPAPGRHAPPESASSEPHAPNRPASTAMPPAPPNRAGNDSLPPSA